MREGKLRKILGVILGAMVGNIVFFLASMVANGIYPTPPELMDPSTPEATALRVAMSPTNGLLLVLLGMALGGFLGGGAGSLVARAKVVWITSTIGGLLSLWAFFSFYVFYPAKLWFPIGLLILALLFSYFGGVATEWQKGRTAPK